MLAKIKEMLYWLLDQLTLGGGIPVRISGYCLRLPTRYHRYFEGDYELVNVGFIHSSVRPGMVAIDVGAHLGLMSVVLGQRVSSSGRVLALEPTPSTFELLRQTLTLNGLGSTVTPLQRVATCEPGMAEFFVTDAPAQNSNSLVRKFREQESERGIRVQASSIDSLVEEFALGRVSFLKIDAEGAELSVLQGAKKTLQRDRPRVLLALHPPVIKSHGHSLEAIWDLVTSQGYRVFYHWDEWSREEFCSREGLFDVFLVAKGSADPDSRGS